MPWRWLGAFQSSGLLSEPFQVGAQLGEADVDVADEVAVPGVCQLTRPTSRLRRAAMPVITATGGTRSSKVACRSYCHS
jgi:hypothetical protein